MAIEVPLSNFWVSKFLFLESDSIAVNYSGPKFKPAPFSWQELQKHTILFLYNGNDAIIFRFNKMLT